MTRVAAAFVLALLAGTAEAISSAAIASAQRARYARPRAFPGTNTASSSNAATPRIALVTHGSSGRSVGNCTPM